MWILLAILVVCLTFAVLALIGASVPVIMCAGFAVLIVSIWVMFWAGSWWLAENLDVLFRRFDVFENKLSGSFRDHGDLDRLEGIRNLLGLLAGTVQKLSEMAEFVGEKSQPGFANAVKSFKEAQNQEKLRKKAEEESERRFTESLDAAVLNARKAREREAEIARRRFRESHQNQDADRAERK